MLHWMSGALHHRVGSAAGLATVLICLSSSATLHAQVAGGISGYVKDPSGAAVVGSSVRAVSREQQLSRTVETNQTGFYQICGSTRLYN